MGELHSQDNRSLAVTAEMLARYDKPGPRYTSYPTAPEWRDDFGDTEYRLALADASSRRDEPLSLYVHLPFCAERCLFCGCNVVISKKTSMADRYIDCLDTELKMVSQLLDGRRQLAQLHWGGGTPTYLSPGALERLFEVIARYFDIQDDAEVALEVDPRVTTREQIKTLRGLGFNRISMGVQDLDGEVQMAIGRNQTEEETRALFDMCREEGFEGTNLDLVYGLPKQNKVSWAKTVKSIVDIRPDRLAVYSYAHLPSKLHHQRHIDADQLPTGPEKYELFATARRMLLEGGYRAIGMDHFALPDDELSHALDERRLHRNFMGYTTVPAAEMLGVGMSSIGEIGGSYAQNEKRLYKYYRAIDEGRFSTVAGCQLTPDDEIRRWVIRQLMCNFFVDGDELRKRYKVEYDDYFASEERALKDFYNEGFVQRDNGNLKVLPLGQAFIRNVAMVFDAYLKKPGAFEEFSRTV